MNYIEFIDMLDEVNDSLVIIIVIFMINIIQLTGVEGNRWSTVDQDSVNNCFVRYTLSNQ